jgi:hypothetical protein
VIDVAEPLGGRNEGRDDAIVGDGGESSRTYSLVVPSWRTAPVVITRSPKAISGWIPPQEPTRIQVSAPTRASSSTAMAAEGLPIPVELTETACLRQHRSP